MWANGSNYSCAPLSSTTLLKTAAALRGAAGLTSLVFSILALVLSVLSKKYLVPLHRMILYYSTCCVLKGITSALNRVDYFVENTSSRAFCVAVGFADMYSSLTLVFSSLSIAFHLFLKVLGRESSGRWAQHFWPLFIFLFPLTFCWMPFINGAYGQSADRAWCSLRLLLEDCSVFTLAVAFEYVVWFVPAILCTVAAIFLYVFSVVVVVRRHAHWNPLRHDADDVMTRKQLEREVATLALLVLTYVITNLPSLLLMILERKGVEIVPLWFISAILPPLCPGLAAFFITVDKGSCTVLFGCSKLSQSGVVRTYAIKPVVDGSDSIRRPNQATGQKRSQETPT